MKSGTPNCLIVTDGRQGNRNQAIGFAEAINNIRPLNYSETALENFRIFNKLPTYLQYILNKIFKIHKIKDQNVDIAIGCGRHAIAHLIDLKEKNPNIYTIYIQDPKYKNNNFDLIIAPQHDDLKGKNIISMIGPPNRITKNLLKIKSQKFSKKINDFPAPRATICIGGNSKNHKLTKENHFNHIQVFKSLIKQNFSIFITTSRRTPKWVMEEYKELSDEYESVWGYFGKGENPYYAFLEKSDIILVTEDSANMVTEAASVGGKVFTLPVSGGTKKFKELNKVLKNRCNISYFNGDFNTNNYKPLKETHLIATKFWLRYDKYQSRSKFC